MKKIQSYFINLLKIGTHPLVDAFRMFYKRPGMLSIVGLCWLFAFYPITLLFAVMFFGLLIST